MKRSSFSTKLALLTTLIGSALVCSIALSVSWFNPKSNVTPSNVTGITEGAYFESGDGSESTPFIISHPIHMYNLAWLQYIGYLNNGKLVKPSPEAKATQYYFKLKNDIDMSTLATAIPPIGTSLYPFVGNFNGNGHVITGSTTSNSFADTPKHPTDVSSISNAEIVGLFGVVGALPTSTFTYDSSINAIYNLGISGITVKTTTSQSLIGMAAGYVNGTLQNVAVDASTINITAANTAALGSNNGFTDNLSDYGVVGYCTTGHKKDISKVDESIYSVNVANENPFVIQEEGTEAGWGGSVNMLEMYNKLKTIWGTLRHGYTSSNTVNPITYYANREITIEKDGSTTVNSETNPTQNNMYGTENGTFTGTQGRSYYHKYYNVTQSDTDGKNTASYGFVVQTSGTSYDDESRFMCLTGYKTVKVNRNTTNSQLTGTTLKTNYYDNEYTGHYVSIVYNNTTYYLTANGTTRVTYTTDQSNATVWKFANNTLYGNVNDTIYYLNATNGTTPALSTTNSTTWSYDSSNDAYIATYNGNSYVLSFTGTNWTFASISLYYLIYDSSNHYFVAPTTDTYTLRSGSRSDSIHWFYNSSLNCYYYLYNGTKARYLLYYNSDNAVIANATQSGGYYTLTSGNITGTGKMKSSSGNYYIRYNNNAWTSSGNQSQGATMTVEQVTTISAQANTYQHIDMSVQASEKQYEKKSKTETVDGEFDINHTYFPLRQKDNQAGVPADTNTGYVVSGGNYYGDPYGDIRVSQYPISNNISGSLGGTQAARTINDTNTLTINSSGSSVAVNTVTWQKYTKAKASFENVLSGQTNVYGLHFMNATIQYGGQHPAIVPKAIVNGKTYTDLELPTDCVDFHLKEKGFINFFAGTYYTDNNSFFSLHEIVRNGNTISEVREIEGIYADNSDTAGIKSYVFKYKGNTTRYSVPFKYSNGVKVKLDGTAYTEHETTGSLASGYTLSFATSRITKPSVAESRLYYFEIPMNEGEYCLGSVSGRNGAYLLYLDIAANASKIQRTIFSEHFTKIEKVYEYPLGIALITPSDVTATTTTNGVTTSTITVDDTNTACVYIQAKYAGTVVLTRASSDVTVSRADTSETSKVQPEYVSDSITLIHDSGGSAPIPVNPKTTNTTDITRMEFYDYDAVNDKLLKTIITDTTVNGTTTRTFQQWDGTTEITNVSDMKIYDASTGKKYTNYNNITITAAGSSTILTYHYVLEDGTTTSSTFVLNATLNNTTSYYTFNGYTITVTTTGGNTVITITSKTGSSTITLNGTTVTGANQTIPVNAA